MKQKQIIMLSTLLLTNVLFIAATDQENNTTQTNIDDELARAISHTSPPHADGQDTISHSVQDGTVTTCIRSLGTNSEIILQNKGIPENKSIQINSDDVEKNTKGKTSRVIVCALIAGLSIANNVVRLVNGINQLKASSADGKNVIVLQTNGFDVTAGLGKGDIGIGASGSIQMLAAGDINVISEGDQQLLSQGSMDVQSGGHMNVIASEGISIASGVSPVTIDTSTNISIQTKENLLLQTINGDITLESDTDSSASGKVNIRSGTTFNAAANKGEIGLAAEEDIIIAADPDGNSSGTNGKLNIRAGDVTPAAINKGDIGLSAATSIIIKASTVDFKTSSTVDFTGVNVLGLVAAVLSNLVGSNATVSGEPGGPAKATGGIGNGSGAGGRVEITGGISGNTNGATGGDVEITAGTSGATDGNGGDVIIKGGKNTGSGVDGKINIVAGDTFPIASEPGEIGIKAKTNILMQAGTTGNFNLSTGTAFPVASNAGEIGITAGKDLIIATDAFDTGKINIKSGTTTSAGTLAGDLGLSADNNIILRTINKDVLIDADLDGSSTGKINIRSGTTTSAGTSAGDLGLSAANNIMLSDPTTLIKLIAFLHHHMSNVFLEGTTPTLSSSGSGSYSGIGAFSSGSSTTTGTFDGGNLLLTYNSSTKQIDITGSGLSDQTKSINLGGSSAVVNTASSSDVATFIWHSHGEVEITIIAPAP